MNLPDHLKNYKLTVVHDISFQPTLQVTGGFKITLNPLTPTTINSRDLKK